MRGNSNCYNPSYFFAYFTVSFMKGDDYMIKAYYADVAADMVEYYESKLKEKGVNLFSREAKFNSNNEPYYHYTLICKEGIIDPRYELEL